MALKRSQDGDVSALDAPLYKQPKHDIMKLGMATLPQTFNIVAFNSGVAKGVEERMDQLRTLVPTADIKVAYLMRDILECVELACRAQDTSILISIPWEDVRRDLDQAELLAMCKTALSTGDYSEFLLIERIRQKRPPRVTGNPTLDPHFDYVRSAWKAEYVGGQHEVLYGIVTKMHDKKVAELRTRSNHAWIVQSSGSGKSRMAHEMAQIVFTIPFNLRADSESFYGAFPPPDGDIRAFLDSGYIADAKQRYIFFFSALFKVVNETVGELCQEKYPGPATLARAWHDYLEADGGVYRQALYARVKSEANSLLKAQILKEQKILDTTNAARRDLNDLLETLDRISAPGRAWSELKLVLYFDEAHVLVPSTPQKGKTRLDWLLSALNEFNSLSLFAILLSTQSNLESLVPSLLDARSGRYNRLHAPITETAFDCFTESIILSSLNHAAICTTSYMAQFGRPLWRSIATTWAKEHLHDPEGLATILEDFARTKLLYAGDTAQDMWSYPPAARTAVLDVRIMLSFKSPQYEMDLVASHMRTAYSVSHDWEDVRTGYSSEPILAEAAAAQLHAWREHWPGMGDPAPEILADALKDELLSRGDVGETTGRMLLTMAYDRAVVREHGAQNMVGRIDWSAGVPAITFLEELFTDNKVVLSGRPDNLPGGMTLRETLQGAIVNFTHFVNWADGTATTQDAALVAMLRHAAIRCQNNAGLVNAVIPMLMRPAENLSPAVMSAILVQFRLRGPVGARAGCAIDQKAVGLFSAGDGDPCGPYVTLVMELGVTQPLARAHSMDAQTAQNSATPGTPSTLVTGENRPRDTHPRYSISAYGCSPAVYKVIQEADKPRFKAIVRAGARLAGHPRQDVRALDAVRALKPVLGYSATSFSPVDKISAKAPPDEGSDIGDVTESGCIVVS